jgi:hypothetical protein
MSVLNVFRNTVHGWIMAQAINADWCRIIQIAIRRPIMNISVRRDIMEQAPMGQRAVHNARSYATAPIYVEHHRPVQPVLPNVVHPWAQQATIPMGHSD